MTDACVRLKPVEDPDMEQIRIWLNKDYILKWFNDADEWLRELEERNGSFRFLNHFIVYKGADPIGFCQYYDCFDAQEDWYVVEKPNEVFSIDYLIGEEKYLQKGLGKSIVQALIEKIRKDNPDVEIIVMPAEDNIQSNSVLLSSGFVYDETKKYFRLMKLF